MNFEKALDENFDGFIAKGNNNFIEIIQDGQGTFFVALYFPQYRGFLVTLHYSDPIETRNTAP